MNAQAATPREISTRNNLGSIAGRLDSFLSSLSEMAQTNWYTDEPQGSIANGISPPKGGSHTDLLDHIHRTMDQIELKIQFIAARL